MQICAIIAIFAVICNYGDYLECVLEPLQSHCEDICTNYFIRIRIAKKFGSPNTPTRCRGLQTALQLPTTSTKFVDGFVGPRLFSIQVWLS